jgi:hypothetical protein
VAVRMDLIRSTSVHFGPHQYLRGHSILCQGLITLEKEGLGVRIWNSGIGTWDLKDGKEPGYGTSPEG